MPNDRSRCRHRCSYQYSSLSGEIVCLGSSGGFSDTVGTGEFVIADSLALNGLLFTDSIQMPMRGGRKKKGGRVG